jgi:glycosyltransferase involved in cell wall biosynthesis
MRVLIDTTYAQRAPHSGTAVYLDRLIDALGREPEIELVTEHHERRRPPAGGGLGSVRNLLSDRGWTEFELPRRARAARADVIHHPLAARARRAEVAQVVTIHDLAFERLPELFDERFRLYAHYAYRAAARAAGAVICVSDSTAADVRELWGVPAERIVVARHGPGQPLPAVQRGVPEHFLYVGDAEPRKDLGTVLAAYARYRAMVSQPLGLVLAGSVDSSVDGVRVERTPDAARLAQLYAGAVALVHASLYEGFGLTPLEAMGAGTPVIAARVAGVTEVCGDAARFAEPGDAASFADAMSQIAADPAAQMQLAESGRRRAAEFSWAASARAHAEAYSLAVGSGV